MTSKPFALLGMKVKSLLEIVIDGETLSPITLDSVGGKEVEGGLAKVKPLEKIG